MEKQKPRMLRVRMRGSDPDGLATGAWLGGTDQKQGERILNKPNQALKPNMEAMAKYVISDRGKKKNDTINSVLNVPMSRYLPQMKPYSFLKILFFYFMCECFT